MERKQTCLKNLQKYSDDHEPLFRKALRAFLPESVDDSWLHHLAGNPLFERDKVGVEGAWLSPINLIMEKTEATSTLLAALVLEGLGRELESFEPILAATQVSPLFTEIMRSFFYEGFSSLEKYSVCGKSDPATVSNIAYGLYAFDYQTIRRKEIGIGSQTRLYLSEELAKDCNAFRVGSSSLLTWWQEKEPLTVEEEYFQALIDTEINFRFRRPIKSAAIAAGISRGEVETLVELGDFLGLAGCLGQFADWAYPAIHKNQSREEAHTLIYSLFGLKDIPYRFLGEQLYGTEDAQKAQLLREKGNEFANRAMAALESSSLGGAPREILGAIVECSPHWSAVA